MRRTFMTALACAALTTQAMSQGQPAAQAPQIETKKVEGTEGVYTFRNQNSLAMFIVTSEGVIATDPVSYGRPTGGEQYLAEIRKVTNQPIRYVVYSHDHADHISGGEVFADTAVVVAHDDAKKAIVGEKRPTAVPHVTFSDRLTIELGGTSLELVHVGKNHSNNSLVMRFPKERLLFAVDFIPVETVAFRDFPDAYMPDWVESLKRVEALEFDVLVPGHGKLGEKKHVTMFREYLQDLHAEVLAGARAGKTPDDLVQTIKLPKYEGWTNYKESLALNIQGMYRLIQANRRPN
jgi:glyoxylase-like metal-dependent hydrolase (beta-lactamase superfamily II)